jgi:plasmid stabilization system protein ParE
MPSASDRAEARGVVALREPLADRDVEDVVRAYLRAFEREDEPALVQLLAQEAASLGRTGSSRQQLIDSWRTKLKSFEYQRLAGLEIARITQLERHSFETLGVPGSPARPQEMRPGDLYIRVPILTPRIGSEQLFGDVLVLLLRREDGRLKIAGQADEN